MSTNDKLDRVYTIIKDSLQAQGRKGNLDGEGFVMMVLVHSILHKNKSRVAEIEKHSGRYIVKGSFAFVDHARDEMPRLVRILKETNDVAFDNWIASRKRVVVSKADTGIKPIAEDDSFKI